MNIIAAGEVGFRLADQGVSAGDISALVTIYRSIAAGTFKAATLTDAQIALIGKMAGELAAVVKDPTGRAQVRTLLASL